MGYYTAYNLEVRDATEEQLNGILAFLRERSVIGYALDDELGCYETVKWYEHDDDMTELSEQFPNILFCLHGEGEENGDLWNKYYQSGKVQVCYAEIMYPEFDPRELKPVKQP